MKFAAFVMTFKRTEKLIHTIEKIFQQSCPPQRLLIIDNDPDCSAKTVLSSFPRHPIYYYSVGYNSGPAGASKIGLRMLVDQGFDWIAWMDDDDPPFFENTFEVLLGIAKSSPRIGCVGSVGQRFSLRRGLIERINDRELEDPGVVYVDNIAGNMSKIVNAEVIRSAAVLPDEKLFFGFEELDFDLKLKAAGFSIVCDKEHYKLHRVYHNRLGTGKRVSRKKSKRELIREYYSTRNILFILGHYKSLLGVISVMMRSVLKGLLGFRHGFSYGLSNVKILAVAIIHFVQSRKGHFAMLAEK